MQGVIGLSAEDNSPVIFSLRFKIKGSGTTCSSINFLLRKFHWRTLLDRQGCSQKAGHLPGIHEALGSSPVIITTEILLAETMHSKHQCFPWRRRRLKVIVLGILKKMHVFGRNNAYPRNVRREEPETITHGQTEYIGERQNHQRERLRHLGAQTNKQTHCAEPSLASGPPSCPATYTFSRPRLRSVLPWSTSKGPPSGDQSLAVPPPCLTPISHSKHGNFKNHCCLSSPCSWFFVLFRFI